MPKIAALIGAAGGVELTQDGLTGIQEVGSMEPIEAAFLGRAMLASAAALSMTNPPVSPALITDAHLPAAEWKIGISNITGQPVIIVSVPPGIELTFELSARGALALGNALISQSKDLVPPEVEAGTRH